MIPLLGSCMLIMDNLKMNLYRVKFRSIYFRNTIIKYEYANSKYEALTRVLNNNPLIELDVEVTKSVEKP